MTRPEVGALGEALQVAGATVVHVPLIEVGAPLDGGAALSAALGRLEEFDWLAVTSANGARAVGDAAAAHPSVRLAAVGGATALALAELAGRPVDLVPHDQRAKGLVEEFPAGGGRVLLAQADRAGSQLADGLRAKGADVEAVVAYRTVLRAPSDGEREQLRSADVVVLSSGSAAESLHAAIGVPDARLVAIGPTTAATARGLGLTVTVAASPATADVVAAVLAVPA